MEIENSKICLTPASKGAIIHCIEDQLAALEERRDRALHIPLVSEDHRSELLLLIEGDLDTMIEFWYFFDEIKECTV